MSSAVLTQARMKEGVWEGILTARLKPLLQVTHRTDSIPNVAVTAEGDGEWRVRVPIPAETLSDGVQTFLVQDQESGETLTSFSIAAGAALSEDMRAEVELLRAELDMLKRAFRRHCVETET